MCAFDIGVIVAGARDNFQTSPIRGPALKASHTACPGTSTYKHHLSQALAHFRSSALPLILFRPRSSVVFRGWPNNESDRLLFGYKKRGENGQQRICWKKLSLHLALV